MSSYPTNLTDKQWQVIENIVETKERKRKHSLREMINALMYLTKTGCQWRMLPKEFGPWQTVYFYFRKWKLEGVFEELMHYLRDVVRKSHGKEISPSVGLIDLLFYNLTIRCYIVVEVEHSSPLKNMCSTYITNRRLNLQFH